MVHASDALKELYLDLQKTKAPLERLRLISQGWRVIRNLNHEERNDLAARLGLEGAAEIVERLAQRENSRVPLAMLDALHHLKRADASEMRWLIHRLREADERHELSIDGRATAAKALAAKEAAVAQPPMAATPAYQEFVIPPSPPIPTTPPSAQRTSVPAAQIATPKTPPSIVAPVSPKPIARQIEALVEGTPPGLSAPAPIAAAEEAIEIASAPARPVVSASPPPTLDSLLADLRARSSDLSRTHRILNVLSSLHVASTAEWRRLIETHTGGWSRRRALIAFIDKGFIDNAEQALLLTGDLEAEWDRFQCLAALARRGALAKSSDSALALVESDHLRKRLQRMIKPDRMAATRSVESMVGAS